MVYDSMSNRQKRKLEKQDKEKYDLLEQRKQLHDKYTKLSSSIDDNENWNEFRLHSEGFVSKNGHKKYREIIGNKNANLYYTDLWRKGLDEKIDYDSGKVYYRNLSDEL